MVERHQTDVDLWRTASHEVLGGPLGLFEGAAGACPHAPRMIEGEHHVAIDGRSFPDGRGQTKAHLDLLARRVDPTGHLPLVTLPHLAGLAPQHICAGPDPRQQC